jgi:AsmA protein
METGRITFLNRQAGVEFLLEDADLAVTLESLDRPLGIKGDAVYGGEGVDFDLAVGAVRAAMAGGETPLTLRLKSQPLVATFEGALIAKSGDLDGALKASGPNLRALARWAGQPIGEGAGLAAFSVDGNVKLAAKSMSLENVSVALDAVKGRGDLLIETGRAKPFLSGRLELTTPLDLNTYLYPAAANGAVQPASAGGAAVTIAAVDVSAPAWSQARIEMGGLKLVDANIELTTQRLLMQKVVIDRAQGTVVLSDGFLAAALNDFAMYGGQGSGRVEINARDSDIVLRHQLDATGVAAEAFLKDAVGFSQLSGVAALKLDLTGKGATQDAMMKALSGSMDLRLKEGGLRGVDLGGLSRTIGNALNGQMVSETASTPFTDFAVTFRVVDGVAATRDLRIRAKDAEVSAAGIIDIGNRRIDMRVTPRAESFLSRLGGPFKGAGVVFPFHISGSWNKATYVSDMRGRAKAAIDARVATILRTPSPSVTPNAPPR